MTFLVELFVSRAGAADVGKIDARARAAAEQLALEGAPVRHLRTTLVPADEMCLLLYEAPNRELALEAARRAGISFDRALEAIEASR